MEQRFPATVGGLRQVQLSETITRRIQTMNQEHQRRMSEVVIVALEAMGVEGNVRSVDVVTGQVSLDE